MLSALGPLGWNVEGNARGFVLGQGGSQLGVLQSDSGPGHMPSLKGAWGLKALPGTHSQSYARPAPGLLNSGSGALSNRELSFPKTGP